MVASRSPPSSRHKSAEANGFSPSNVIQSRLPHHASQIDKEFESPESSANPYPQSDDSILIWQAVLDSLSVLVFPTGPEGVVTSAGLEFVPYALSAVPSSNQGALDNLKVIGELIRGKSWWITSLTNGLSTSYDISSLSARTVTCFTL